MYTVHVHDIVLVTNVTLDKRLKNLVDDSEKSDGHMDKIL